VDAAAGADAAVDVTVDGDAGVDAAFGAGGAGGTSGAGGTLGAGGGTGGAGGLASGGAGGGTDTGGTGGLASGGAGGGTGGSSTPDAPAASCGNGVVESPEQCDDTNNIPGDGCSELCTIELGFKCSGSPSVCTPSKCGDGVVEGTERCDDGNTMPFDGCSIDCQFEPDCSGASCVSKCGDGLVIGEECDDGNAIDGDGCSSTCTIEAGWKCSQPPMGNRMLAPTVYRDFKYHNPSDFEAGVTGSTVASAGAVEAALDSEGKPVFTGVAGAAIHIESKSTFAMWYRNTAGVNHATSSKLALWDNGSGAYVNRYGATGERWNVTETAYYCGNVGYELLDSSGAKIPCTMRLDLDAGENSTDCTTLAANGYEMAPGSCKASAGSYSAQYIVSKVDGNPLFFPVDDDSFSASEKTAAQIPPYYDATATWPYDVDSSGNKIKHNFSFTSEIRYYFKYEAGKAFQVDINGDDDVWVFVNKKLAVDLGGVHMPVEGSVTLDASSATKFGLTDGKVYEIAVFQAERQTNSSTFKITLGGFNTAPSTCTLQ
jgi:fibro-slime domain-containing protein